ncbi:MAG: hypothetical protein D6714_11800 [Bacteroidetes bacterium]|nr:MAG: hypothetical protein D6714_11800 [Bacteroidota bacterium]
MQFLAYKTTCDAVLEDDARRRVNQLREENLKQKHAYFELYQNGQLSDDEKQVFEQNLREDPLLQYEFKKFKTQSDATPQPLFDQPQPEQPEAKVVRFSRQSRIRLLSLAASLTLLLGVFWWVNRGNGSEINHQLYASYFERPNTGVVKMDWSLKAPGTQTSNSELAEIKNEALDAFEAEDWHTAIQKIDTYVKKSERTDDTYYLLVYAGVSYMELGLYNQAIETLTLSMENIKDLVNNSRRKETAQWYLALAYLKNGNTQKFLELTRPLTQATNKKVRANAIQILCDFNPENCPEKTETH